LSTTLDTSTLGEHTFVVSAADVAGNTTTQTYTYTVVDTIAPTVTVTPAPTGDYAVGSTVDVTCAFEDSGSGLASVACGTLTGGDVSSLPTTLDTSTPGPKTFEASATDAAGNMTTRTFAYEVIDTQCDPVGDASSPDADIVRCRSVSNSDGTATLSVIVDGDIVLSGVQYRLRLASNPNKTGKQVKWVGGNFTGRELLAVTVSGDRIDFLIDVDRVGVDAGETLYWYAEVQDGVSGNPNEGFLDRAPDDGLGWFELVI
jgi:hypothetical protein